MNRIIYADGFKSNTSRLLTIYNTKKKSSKQFLKNFLKSQ